MLERKMSDKCRELFLKKIKDLYQKYNNVFKSLENFIAEIDWTVSCAKSAITYFYCKPKIITKNGTNNNGDYISYIDAKDMRHPIIERIQLSTHYVPNDVYICESGLILGGTNSSGKSSLMKATGVNTVMAQAGMYVACSEFDYYPYKNIITRIISEDNFSKGYSSFIVELTELRTILNHSTKNTLVIGDEICHGTEHTSALVIVTRTIEELSKRKCSFIFATHLHLNELDEFKALKNVKSKHLKVINDDDNDCLIFDRKLEDGPGEKLYGLEVAKHIFRDNPEFINKCMTLRKKVLNIPEEILPYKPSPYNSKLIVNICKICGKSAVDTHHIDEQCTADECGNIERENLKFHKNKLSNLVPLCKMCHIKVHHFIDNKKYVIEGYISTTKGTTLKWKEIDCNNI